MTITIQTMMKMIRTIMKMMLMMTMTIMMMTATMKATMVWRTTTTTILPSK